MLKVITQYILEIGLCVFLGVLLNSFYSYILNGSLEPQVLLMISFSLFSFFILKIIRLEEKLKEMDLAGK